jgi:hypothetical protein
MATSTFRDDPMIANRYLADQLSESERTAYEAALEQDPEALKELEATARLKIGLHRLRADGELESLMRGSRVFRSPVLLAMAAAVAAIVIGLGVWRFGVESARPQLLAATLSALHDRNGRTLPLGGTQVMFRKRAEAYDAVIEVPPGQAVTELRVLPEAPVSTAKYGVALTRVHPDGSEERLDMIDGLAPASDGFISVYADSSKLSPGKYRLDLRRVDIRMPTAESFSIKVTKGPS